MPGSLSDDLLGALSSWLADRTGLHFPRERWVDMSRGVTTAARDLQFAHAESYVRHLLSSEGTREEIESVVSHLTVGETYFFRHKESLAALKTLVLPALIQARRKAGHCLRIWSAGCCTGEEPYTLAIVLQQIMPDWRDWNITILATDINANFLRRARHGLYRDWSFRETGPDIQRRFFTNPQKGCFEILPEIRAMVRFNYLNLAENSYPSLLDGIHSMDLILCRNVLMYFSLEQTRETVRRLRESLAPDGWLVVSPSEASQTLMADFSHVMASGAILYSKAGLPGPVVPLPTMCAPSGLQSQEDFGQTGIGHGIDDALPDPGAPAAEVAPVRQTASAEQQARDFYELGDYASATEILLKALLERPADSPAMALLARMRANQGALEEAWEWCRKAITADKLNPGRHYLMGTILQEGGQFVEAAASLNRALYLDPDFVLAHFALGNLTRRQGQNNQSLRHFRNALRALRTCPPDVPLPEADGICPERLAEIIQSSILSEMGNSR